ETEEVGNTQQNPFDVTAVPEPHEYLLLAIGAGLLVWYLRKRKRAIYSA
ncbi:MAG: PEP-CTERM sorting domain-containing protein, partial [Chloroflexi bacterium]|nr:PEP-CTERM sorting domain-containing protein [Chloroflexota bacterium]